MRPIALALALVLSPALALAEAPQWLADLRAQDRIGSVTVAPALALPELVVGCALGHPIDLVALEICGGASSWSKRRWPSILSTAMHTCSVRTSLRTTTWPPPSATFAVVSS